MSTHQPPMHNQRIPVTDLKRPHFQTITLLNSRTRHLHMDHSPTILVVVIRQPCQQAIIQVQLPCLINPTLLHRDIHRPSIRQPNNPRIHHLSKVIQVHSKVIRARIDRRTKAETDSLFPPSINNSEMSSSQISSRGVIEMEQKYGAHK